MSHKKHARILWFCEENVVSLQMNSSKQDVQRMIKYLDPKADLTFKKIFGEHEDLLISLLNALLPLKEDEQVEEVEFLSYGLGVVNARCKDVKGCSFLLSIQIHWTTSLLQLALFNASKAFVRQLDKRRRYELLQPVYSLNLVNEVFMKDYPDEFIHNYNIVHDLHDDKLIKGLHFTFIELPKFKPQTIMEKKMAVLWLKFLTQIDEDTTVVPQDLLDNPETSKALETVEEAAMTKNELLAYDDFWDKVGAERLLFIDSNKISREKGFAKGRAVGLEEGRQEGREEARAEMVRLMLAKGMSQDQIASLTDLSQEAVRALIGQNVEK